MGAALTARRVGWFVAGLVAVLGAGALAVWTVVFVLSAEYATPAWTELALVAITVGVLVGGLAAIRRAVRARNSVTAVRPLVLAALCALVWFAAAPL